MIASLKGELQAKTTDRVVIDVGGVGYEVFLSLASLERMPSLGSEVFLHVYTNVRDDAIILFGFSDHDEKEMFLLLIGVNGIGPKLALGILSGIRPAGLTRAIAEKNFKVLTGLSGVGRKTAERICLDLQDKIGMVAAADAGGELVFQAGGILDGSLVGDVVSALVNLGYPAVRAQQALTAVRKRLSPEAFAAMRLEELLRETLRTMA